jgi:hypothetical protein
MTRILIALAALLALAGCGTTPSSRACVDDSACVAPRLCIDGFCEDPNAGDVLDEPPPDVVDEGDPGDIADEEEPIARTCLRFEPSSLNFGEVAVGGTGLLTTRVLNCSTLPVELSSIEVTGADAASFGLAEVPATPLTLGAGEAVELGLVARPTRAGPQEAELRVTYERSEFLGALLVTGTEELPCGVPYVGATPDLAETPRSRVELPLGAPVYLVTVAPDGRGFDRAEWTWTLGGVVDATPADPGGYTLVTPPGPGLWRFEFTWASGPACGGVEVVEVSVGDAPAGDPIEVVLEWRVGAGAAADLDLHVARVPATGEVPWSTEPGDCYYRNPTPDWGPAGPVGDPVFSGDDTGTPGREITRIAAPADDTYYLGVQLYRDQGAAGEGAAVTITVGGQSLSLSAELPRNGSVWYPAAIVRGADERYSIVPSGRITDGFVPVALP